MSQRSIVHILLGAILLALYAGSYQALQQHRTTQRQEGKGRSAWGELPPLALKVLAGEFRGLMADFLVLDIGAQLGTELVRTPDGKYRTVVRKADWPSLHRQFVASQALDPSFQQTYMLAEGWLPWEGKMVPETHAILRTAAANRPWDWQPLHFVGFNTYYFLNQPGEAGKIFLEAAKTPNAPPFLAILGGRLAMKGGETEAAIVLMRSMLKDKSEEDSGYADIVDRLHALEGVRELELAVQQYEKRFGQRPPSLDELTSSGILAALPPNPYNLAYCLGADGLIYFDNPNCK